MCNNNVYSLIYIYRVTPFDLLEDEEQIITFSTMTTQEQTTLYVTLILCGWAKLAL